MTLAQLAAYKTQCLRKYNAAFTLIELSIVLVIIGLIVGGVLVGRDMIASAQTRAQISQVERYQAAMNTFKVKTGYLPGDIPEPDATKFGFAPRGVGGGTGDGNGLIQGGYGVGPNGWVLFMGETGMFWSDMSFANGMNWGLIDGRFSTARMDGGTGIGVPITGVSLYLPEAKLGGGNYVYVFESGACCGGGWVGEGQNWMGVGKIIGSSGGGLMMETSGLTVQQASKIDAKADDGFPQTGVVHARMVVSYAAGSGYGATATAATASSSITCFDNNNISNAVQRYSLTYNNGSNVNCAIAYKLK